jgi:hypothetical protein
MLGTSTSASKLGSLASSASRRSSSPSVAPTISERTICARGASSVGGPGWRSCRPAGARGPVPGELDLPPAPGAPPHRPRRPLVGPPHGRRDARVRGGQRRPRGVPRSRPRPCFAVPTAAATATPGYLRGTGLAGSGATAASRTTTPRTTGCSRPAAAWLGPTAAARFGSSSRTRTRAASATPAPSPSAPAASGAFDTSTSRAARSFPPPPAAIVA